MTWMSVQGIVAAKLQIHALIHIRAHAQMTASVMMEMCALTIAVLMGSANTRQIQHRVMTRDGALLAIGAVKEHAEEHQGYALIPDHAPLTGAQRI